MRRLILQMQMSVDGVVESSARGMGWQLWDWSARCPWDDSLRTHFNEAVCSADTILLSRNMLEQGYLAHSARIASVTDGDALFAFSRHMLGMKKVVVTRKRSLQEWSGVDVRRGPLREIVPGLKQTEGGDIICFGGTGFASALIADGLVDELQFFINPAAVGRGRSLFGNVDHCARMKLIDAQGYGCGVVVVRYSPEGRREVASRAA